MGAVTSVIDGHVTGEPNGSAGPLPSEVTASAEFGVRFRFAGSAKAVLLAGTAKPGVLELT
jgi:hypothetical protein